MPEAPTAPIPQDAELREIVSNLDRNPERTRRIKEERLQKEKFFDNEYPKLSDDDRKRFETLMLQLILHEWLDHGRHDARIMELKWEKLPLFLKDKGIKTLREANVLMKLFRNIKDRLAWALDTKPQGVELPDWEIIDKSIDN